MEIYNSFVMEEELVLILDVKFPMSMVSSCSQSIDTVPVREVMLV
jgi:hypothetical protein